MTPAEKGSGLYGDPGPVQPSLPLAGTLLGFSGLGLPKPGLRCTISDLRSQAKESAFLKFPR